LSSLSEEGYSGIGATDGADALEQLSDFALPDVVLLDLGMPRMDGYEFLERDADELFERNPGHRHQLLGRPDALG
jgi:CheY-like chemotaxis protein